jgi:hypothetical protein
MMVNGNANLYKLINVSGTYLTGNLVNYPYAWESREKAQTIADSINRRELEEGCVQQRWCVVMVGTLCSGSIAS